MNQKKNLNGLIYYNFLCVTAHYRCKIVGARESQFYKISPLL